MDISGFYDVPAHFLEPEKAWTSSRLESIATRDTLLDLALEFGGWGLIAHS
jgi:hypothetical protein